MWHFDTWARIIEGILQFWGNMYKCFVPLALPGPGMHPPARSFCLAETQVSSFAGTRCGEASNNQWEWAWSELLKRDQAWVCPVENHGGWLWRPHAVGVGRFPDLFPLQHQTKCITGQHPQRDSGHNIQPGAFWGTDFLQHGKCQPNTK